MRQQRRAAARAAVCGNSREGGKEVERDGEAATMMKRRTSDGEATYKRRKSDGKATTGHRAARRLTAAFEHRRVQGRGGPRLAADPVRSRLLSINWALAGNGNSVPPATDKGRRPGARSRSGIGQLTRRPASPAAGRVGGEPDRDGNGTPASTPGQARPAWNVRYGSSPAVVFSGNDSQIAPSCPRGASARPVPETGPLAIDARRTFRGRRSIGATDLTPRLGRQQS